jgi:hypothetical protein
MLAPLGFAVEQVGLLAAGLASRDARATWLCCGAGMLACCWAGFAVEQASLLAGFSVRLDIVLCTSQLRGIAHQTVVALVLPDLPGSFQQLVDRICCE